MCAAPPPRVIAEIKRRSPSRGEIRPGFDPVGCAKAIFEKAGVPLVPGYHDSLSRAVLNLLVNAQEALVDQPGGRVILGAQSVPGGVEIYVRDNGPGVPPELQDAIWSPEVTTRRRGSGLGLAMVRQTAQAHGGEATLVSPDEGGAEFRLFIPAKGEGSSDALPTPGEG